MSEPLALALWLAAFVVPAAHVAVSPRGGPFAPPPGARCPLGPRAGWLVIVLVLGPVGWLAYMLRRRRRAGL